MGNVPTKEKLNFEDIQYIRKHPNIYLFINTLPVGEQDCLILGSINASQEETVINEYIIKNKQIPIVIYGKNTNDETLITKFQQLTRLGFTNVFIYLGGLFEWLMLQDIYGFEEFPTTRKELDFLKYKPRKQLHINLIGNG
jgi:hypothetical protein